MATVDECEQALHTLAARLADNGGRPGFDRSLSCRLIDPDVAFAGRLADGLLVGISRTDTGAAATAQVRLTMAADDLLALVAGTLKLAPAWTSGRVKIEAGVRDLLRLRALF